nr:callose synthase 7-like [Tanacetum cinerariifolium]
MAKDFKGKEDADLFRKINSDDYMRSSVTECCQTVRDILFGLLNDERDNMILQYIFHEVETCIEQRMFLSKFRVSKLPSLNDKMVKFLEHLVTPPTTIQKISDNNSAPKLQSKRKYYVSRETMQRKARTAKSHKSLNYGSTNMAFELRPTEDVLLWPGSANMAFDLRPTKTYFCGRVVRFNPAPLQPKIYPSGPVRVSRSTSAAEEGDTVFDANSSSFYLGGEEASIQKKAPQMKKRLVEQVRLGRIPVTVFLQKNRTKKKCFKNQSRNPEADLRNSRPVLSLYFSPKDQVEESDAAREKFYVPESNNLTLLTYTNNWKLTNTLDTGATLITCK